MSTRFLSEVFHASTAVAGLATGIIVIGCLVGRFFTGSIVHTAGYRRVLFCGVVLYLLTNAAYFFADTLTLIFLVRFVFGRCRRHRRHGYRHHRRRRGSFAAFQSVAQVSAISMVTRERYAQVTSTFYIFFDLGIGLAPYLAGYIAPTVGYDGVYGLNAVVVSLCIVWYAVLHLTGRLSKRPSLGQAVNIEAVK